MKHLARFLKVTAASAALLAFTGCESTDGGNVSASMYYGVGFYDPWYYGGYWDDPDIIVTPPVRPEEPVKPTHPIVEPPVSTKPAPRPMPSIPSAPRPAPRPSFRR